jgi:15-cis-phytoene synthase
MPATEPCAALVARADPDRYRAAMAAPPGARPALFALYAFNVEISRAPWVASEPMIGQIRLKWWDEAISEIYDGRPARRHEVVEPLAAAILAADLPARLFHETIEARMFDVDAAPFASVDALSRHIGHTAAHLMEAAARILGAEGAAIPVIRDYAWGTGLAAFLRALPDYEARGRAPLPGDARLPDLVDLATARIATARSHRDRVPRWLLPALLPGALATARLARLRRAPAARAPGVMELSPFEERARLAWVAATGRW